MAKASPGPTSLSVQLTRAVLDSALNPTQKVVAIAMVSHASARNNQRVWPGLERIAWLSNLSRSTVKRTIAELEELGILVRVAEGPIGREIRVGFDVWPDRLPTRPPWRPGSLFRHSKGVHGEPLSDAAKGFTGEAKGVHGEPERGSARPEKGVHPRTKKGFTMNPEEDLSTEEDLKAEGTYVREEDPPRVRAEEEPAAAPRVSADKKNEVALVRLARNVIAVNRAIWRTGSKRTPAPTDADLFARVKQCADTNGLAYTDNTLRRAFNTADDELFAEERSVTMRLFRKERPTA